MERDFKGVWIPKEIWLDERLNALDKIIFVEIDSLCHEDRGCFASNKYLAGFCQCSETKISKAVSKLIDLGYLYVVSFNGRQRELQSCLAKNARQDNKKCKADKQKVQGSIYSNNNTVNNTFNNISVPEKERTPNHKENKKFTPPTIDEVKEYCHERNNHVDPEKFVTYYDSVGWYVGNKKMKNWKSSVLLWEKGNTSEQSTTISTPSSYDISAYENYSIFDDQ